MTDLSSAARTVVDAYNSVPLSLDLSATYRAALAAALRAAADQCAEGLTHFKLYVIAAELEDAN